MKKYYWMMGVYLACVFVAGKVYAFVYDVEPNTHFIDDYFKDMSETDNTITICQWLEQKDMAREEAFEWFGDECDCALNPWYNPYGYGEKE